ASGGARGAEAAAASAEALRRFSILLERLEAQGGIGVVPVPTGEPGPAPNSVAATGVPVGGVALAGVPVAGAPGAGVPGAVPMLRAVDPSALAFAARSSHSNQELQLYLTRFKEMGVEAGTDHLLPRLAPSRAG